MTTNEGRDMSGDNHNQADQPTRQALMPQLPHGWVTVCNWCECVIVNPQAHAKVCPNRGEVSA